MKISLFYEFALPRPWQPDDERVMLLECLDEVEAADKAGFSTVWLTEHHFLEEYCHSTAPEMFLAAASQRTKDIRLGFGIMHLPPAVNHPARVAERIATLDLISNGRVEEALPDALHIAWDPSTGMDIEGYYVYRSFSMDGPWGPAPIAILEAAEHGYIDSPLPPETQFFYRVMEKDTFGGFTELTNPISGTTTGLSVLEWDRY